MEGERGKKKRKKGQNKPLGSRSLCEKSPWRPSWGFAWAQMHVGKELWDAVEVHRCPLDCDGKVTAERDTQRETEIERERQAAALANQFCQSCRKGAQ